MPSGRSLASIVAALVIAAAAAWLNAGNDTVAKDPSQVPDCVVKDPKDAGTTNCRAPTHGPAIPQGKGFDYYVLSLSWSPTWCLANDSDGKSRQCDRDSDFGYVVHGLWPSRLTGEAEFCPTRQSDRVPDMLVSNNLDIMPSAGLIGHQWRKHGTCSGLSQEDYFKVVRAARNRIFLPAGIRPEQGDNAISASEIRDALVKSNEGLPADGVLVTCEADRLDEIRFCLTKDLEFRACPADVGRGCNRRDLTIPPVL